MKRFMVIVLLSSLIGSNVVAMQRKQFAQTPPPESVPHDDGTPRPSTIQTSWAGREFMRQAIRDMSAMTPLAIQEIKDHLTRVVEQIDMYDQDSDVKPVEAIFINLLLQVMQKVGKHKEPKTKRELAQSILNAIINHLDHPENQSIWENADGSCVPSLAVSPQQPPVVPGPGAVTPLPEEDLL